MGLIFQISGATFVQLLRVLNIGFSNFQTHFLKLFATLRNKCYPVLKVYTNSCLSWKYYLIITQSKAALIIKGLGKANDTKSRSPIKKSKHSTLTSSTAETSWNNLPVSPRPKERRWCCSQPCSSFSSQSTWPPAISALWTKTESLKRGFMNKEELVRRGFMTDSPDLSPRWMFLTSPLMATSSLTTGV